METMIAANIGAGMTIRDLLEWVFGKRRARSALQVPSDDPEVVDFAMRLDALIDAEWKRLGASRRLGPYGKPPHSSRTRQ